VRPISLPYFLSSHVGRPNCRLETKVHPEACFEVPFDPSHTGDGVFFPAISRFPFFRLPVVLHLPTCPCPSFQFRRRLFLPIVSFMSPVFGFHPQSKPHGIRTPPYRRTNITQLLSSICCARAKGVFSFAVPGAPGITDLFGCYSVRRH